MSKKLNLHDLARNRDRGQPTNIPLRGETHLQNKDVETVTAAQLIGSTDVTKEEKTEVVVGQIDKNVVPAYVLAKKYVPKTDRNIATWNRLTAALATGPKTLAELTKAVEDHKDFVGYMVRGGHLAAHVQS